MKKELRNHKKNKLSHCNAEGQQGVNKDKINFENESNIFNTQDKFNPNTRKSIHNQDQTWGSNNLLTLNKEKIKVQSICRVCLSEGSELNPLIHPCNCKGSMKHIHLECLRKWLSASIQKKSLNNTTIYTFRKFKCELCHADIPGIYRLK